MIHQAPSPAHTNRRGEGGDHERQETMTKIKIADLDLSLQTRAGTDAETINNYAEAMADGAHFPDVTVFTDGERYWLADGFHRVMAAKQNGKATIPADVRKGTADDAVVFGGTANNKQGKRPTRADVQHFMQMVWERREAIFGGTPTGGNMAEKCGVSRPTGERFVAERLAEMPKAPTRPTATKTQPNMPVRPTKLIGANGREYPVRPASVAPKKPGHCIHTDANGFCTNNAMQGGGFKCMGPECGGRETAPKKSESPYAPVRPTVKKIQSNMPTRPVRKMPVDRYGTEIPVEIAEAFDGSTLSDILSCISKARVALRRGFDEHDPAFAAVRQDALVNLNNAYNFVNAAEPHCVCRMCQGTGCKACHERGWQTKEEYERNPKEFQAKGGVK